MTVRDLQAAASLDAKLVPNYAAIESRMDMTLRHIRWIVALAPVVLIAAIEVVRAATIGAVSLSTRILLDATIAIGFMVTGSLMVRAISVMHERVKRQNQELLALHGAGLDVTSELGLDSVLHKVVDRARALVGAKYGALSVVNESGRIEAFLTSGISDQERARIGAPPVGHGVLGVVLREGQHLRLDNLQAHPQTHGFPPHHPVMHSLLAVPIVCKGPFVGNLYLSEKENGAKFNDDDEQTLVRFAVQAAIAIDNAHLHEKVASLAIAQERLHIAHEMHDGIAQVLGYVNTKVQAATHYIKAGQNEEAETQLRELAASAREAYGDVREAIVDLRTLPERDRTFTDVLRDYVDRWKEQTGISTELTIGTGFVLPPTSELQLIRIVQEALANVRKHARATSVSVDLHRRNGTLVITVADDGIGFNPDAKPRTDFPRFGLATMHERAESIGGVLVVEPREGGGTRVRGEIPLTA